MSSSSSANGLLLALGSASLYGLNIVYAGAATLAGVPGPALVVYRVLLMLVLVFGAGWLMRRSLRAEPGERGTILVLGIATAFVGLCYLSSVAFIPVTVATVVFYAYPSLIVLMSPLVDGTRLTPRLLGVVGLALTGVVLVVGPVFHGLDWRGLALALAAAAATATQFFAAARCRKTTTLAKVFWVHLIVLPTALAVGAMSGQLASPAAFALAPFAIAMTIGGYLVGFVFQIAALGRISAVAAGIAYCVEPVVSAVASTLVLGETLTPIQIVGGALVLAAIMANILSERQHAASLVPTD
ncbi:DMT family transporter [Microvirga brassicacearum]|uniref:DMT family transporter n=1 Tax=Microvirga brassicacearum TaxID=2580413 RepID=A0A5N3P4R7_9HYPH|nr:DMT family transporter [Microvirga brassicacearum]KAB0264705.1 DMT family transporter [Microvirga brassicacearum]